VSYLNTGTGNACDGHNKLKEELNFRCITFVLSPSLIFGLTDPIGSEWTFFKIHLKLNIKIFQIKIQDKCDSKTSVDRKILNNSLLKVPKYRCRKSLSSTYNRKIMILTSRDNFDIISNILFWTHRSNRFYIVKFINYLLSTKDNEKQSSPK
jgi:hypothetical protein